MQMTPRDFFDKISPLTELTWSELSPFFYKSILKKGEHFINTDEVARKIAFLESGIVRAYFINQEGQEYNKQFFSAPSSIGAYTSLLTGKPNLIAQQALTECVIWSIDYLVITSRFDNFPDIERLARKIAEYYFLEKERKELEIVLLNGTERYQIFQSEFPNLEQLIPQYHIASYLGITPIQLSRIRVCWQKNNLLPIPFLKLC